MAGNSNDWHFKRGLNPGFMEKLKSLAEQGGWFSDVLGDRDLILGIRDNYVNVYWRGQSLFKIGGKNGPLRFTTHPKYLIDPRGPTQGIASQVPVAPSHGRFKVAANLPLVNRVGLRQPSCAAPTLFDGRKYPLKLRSPDTLHVGRGPGI